MEQYDFTIGGDTIPYYISEDYESTVKLFSDISCDCFFVVYDKNIDIGSLCEVTLQGKKIVTIQSNVTEKTKNSDHLIELIEELIRKGVTRNSYIIAVGGGVVGNVVGLAASLIYRGLKFIHIPTTIMAASDSVLSIKQAVNSKEVKNIIGSYYAPKFICTIYPFFKSLPKRDFYAGMAEFIKNCLITHYENREFIKSFDYENFNQFSQFDTIIKRSIDTKSKILEDDKFEKKYAVILEYGHTFGHAIEMIMKGSVCHGEGVAFGMIAASIISEQLGYIDDADVQEHLALLQYIMPQLKMIPKIDTEVILKEMKKDNKRGYIEAKQDSIPLVILDYKDTKGYWRLENISNDLIVPAIEKTYELIALNK